MDGRGVPIWMEQEPGSAGVTVIDHYLRLLAGFSFRGERSTGSKADRAQPMAAQAEGGTVKLLRGAWNADYLDEMELFPFGAHDDIVDAAALAFSHLAVRKEFWMRIGDEIVYDARENPPRRRVECDGGIIVEESAAMGKIYTIPAGPLRKGIDIRPDAPGWGRR
jgi:hypothetical protein